MNLLSTILDRLNQRIEVGNIFDQIYGLSELVGEGNDKAWAFYIGNGQAIPVTNFDAKQGTLFWAKRGKITVSKNDSLRLAGCKSIYETRFSMTAYAMVRKSHLPCDSADAQDWVASRVLRLISGTDPQFKTAIGVVAYEVVPNGYATEARYLPVNYEWAAVAIDVDVNVSTTSEDGCYDTCATGDIPLPDFEPCEPCLTSVAVDGVTIIGNGTPADPLVAVGGGGGTPLRTQDEGVNVSTNTTTLNFTGSGVTASLTSPGVVQVNIPSGGGVTAVTATAPLSSSGGATPDISIPQASASVDGYLDSADFATFAGKQDALTAGTGISLASNIVTNTAPDQIVSLTAGTGIAVTGTYPSFTIDNTDPFASPLIAKGDIYTNDGTSDTRLPVGLDTQVLIADSSTATGLKWGSNAAPTQLGYYGAWQDSTTQTAAVNNVGYAIKYDTQDIVPNGISIVNDGSGNPTRITFANTGIYNIQFSAQFQNTSVQLHDVTIWLRLNGVDIPGSSGFLSVPNSHGGTPGHVIAAWNYVLDVVGGQYYELIWSTDSAVNVTMQYYAAGNPPPAAASVILTVTQQSGIMAGTGLTAINSLTGAVQTLATGTTGTDFGISSAGTTHTFNLPTASATNRGALSSADWSTFNGKFNTPSGTTSQYVRGDGSLATFPTIPVIYKSTTDGTASNAALNTLSASQLVPANTFAVGDTIRVTARARKVGAASNLTIRLYANTSNSLTGATLLGTFASAGLMIPIQRHLAIKSATNTEGHSATTSLVSDISPSSVAVTSSNIDWTQAQYIIFAVQNGASADSSLISYYTIEKL